MALKTKLEFQVFIASKQKYNQILYIDQKHLDGLVTGTELIL